MSKSIIYYITKNKNETVYFHKTHYEELVGKNPNIRIEDQTKQQSYAPLKSLSDMLYGLGAVINHENMDNFNFSFSFMDSKKAIQDYFEPKLAKFKEAANKLTISDIMQQAPDFDNISNGDRVVFINGNKEEISTIDNFIRKLESGVDYYVYEMVILRKEK